MSTEPAHPSLTAQLPDPSPGDFPALEAVASKYDQLLDLAGEVLEGRMSARMKLWEDGEVEIRAWHEHGYPDSDVEHRTVLRYHSRSGDVIGAIFEVSGESKTLLHKETITNIGALGPAARRKNWE